MSAKNFFTEEQKQAIQKAIANAELNTSGEIRLHVDSKCKGDGWMQPLKHLISLKCIKQHSETECCFI
jgi:hypothetical protein